MTHNMAYKGLHSDSPRWCPCNPRREPAAKPSRAGRTPTRRHGLGKSGVDALLAEQGGSCAICGVPYEDKPGHRLAMDHDHRHCPGRVGCPKCVRGLLCNSCNNILRLSGENIEVLAKAIGYLQLHQVRATQ